MDNITIAYLMFCFNRMVPKAKMKWMVEADVHMTHYIIAHQYLLANNYTQELSQTFLAMIHSYTKNLCEPNDQTLNN